MPGNPSLFQINGNTFKNTLPTTVQKHGRILFWIRLKPMAKIENQAICHWSKMINYTHSTNNISFSWLENF